MPRPRTSPFAALPDDVVETIVELHGSAFLEDRAQQLVEHFNVHSAPRPPLRRNLPIFHAVMAERAGWAQARSISRVYESVLHDPFVSDYMFTRCRRFYDKVGWHDVAVARPARYTVVLAQNVDERWEAVRAYSLFIPGGPIATVRDRLDDVVAWVLRSGRVQGPYRAPLERPMAFKQWRDNDVTFRQLNGRIWPLVPFQIPLGAAAYEPVE